MHTEIEAKMRLEDAAAMEDRLRELSAEDAGRITEHDVFFDTADQSLRTSDRGLRLRSIKAANGGEHTQSIVTYKGPRSHGEIKKRREIEFEVSDAEALDNLFGELGFSEALRFEKRRRRWKLDACRVELDELPHIGHFIEIEGPTEDAVMAMRDKLGLGDVPLVTSSYAAMLASYLADHGITDRYVQFADESD